jgi:hypothetical protein
MSDIDEIRAKLRGDGTPTSTGNGQFIFLAVIVAGLGFAAVLLGPRVLSGFQSSVAEVKSGGQTSVSELKSGAQESASPGAQMSPREFKASESTPSWLRFGEELPKPPGRGVVANYEGKSPAEIGEIADKVCFNRAQTRDPYWGTTPRLTTQSLANFRPVHMAYFNELLRCLLTEGTRRYCLAGERRMIVAEIAMYFRGIETRNQQVRWIGDESRPKMLGEDLHWRMREQLEGIDKATLLQRNFVEVDPSVITAIEYRLRDGLLTRGDRDRVIAAAPPEIGQRFARIEPPKSSCPDEPWWAFWR